MSLIDRALRMGEGKKFKKFEKQVALVNAFEPEMELLDDDELAAEFAELRERADNGEPLDDLLATRFALTREAGQAHAGHAPLRRAADRRHGAAPRRHRRDEDR